MVYPGIVAAIQTFGDYARWHPHLHPMAVNGLFWESGCFIVSLKINLRPLGELFRSHALMMQKKEGVADNAFIKMLMGWQHVSGFNVHSDVGIKPRGEQGLKISLHITSLSLKNKKRTYSDAAVSPSFVLVAGRDLNPPAFGL